MEKYPYNRERQRDCILTLFPGKTEKSVFRGMAIPTLRKTGLILGYDNSIRLSANGSLIAKSRRVSKFMHERVLQALILDIDKKKFNFVAELIAFQRADNFVSEKSFKEMLVSKVRGPSFRQKLERVSRWLLILKQVGLISNSASGNNISLNKSAYEQAGANLEITPVKNEKFETYLIESYAELRQKTGVIVDLADLREKVAIRLLNNDNEILTEGQFDELLRKFLSEASKYIVSLGRSMGAEEKLFVYNGKHYRTLTLRAMGEK
jgi:hypothetical protein